MNDIVALSGGDAKLRLRGKGSGFVERDTNTESPEPLQLCISCPRQDGYNIAVKAAEDLLRRIYDEYDKWCIERGKSERAPRVRMTEKHHVGELPADPPKRRGGRVAKRSKAAKETPRNEVAPVQDRGQPPPGAPGVEEIERQIKARNDARRRGEFEEADRIREDLRTRGIVLSDEKGAHGSGLAITSWRYWHD